MILNGQALLEVASPPSQGYTGTVEDSLGRTYHYVDGKRTKGYGELHAHIQGGGKAGYYKHHEELPTGEHADVHAERLGKPVEKLPAKVTAAVDANQIKAHADKLKGLFDSALTISYHEIESGVNAIADKLDLPTLKAVSRQAGMLALPSSKRGIARKWIDRISERKGRHERGEVIGQVARGEKSEKHAEEEYQKLGTKAPAFKAWFGDWEKDPTSASKVVDKETGEPQETYPIKKVFHGTTGHFNVFDKGHSRGGNAGHGFYFSEDREMAYTYGDDPDDGRVIEAYLNIRKPFDFDGKISPRKLREFVVGVVDEKAVDFYLGDEQLLGGSSDGTTILGSRAWLALEQAVGRDMVNEVLARAGFDGIKHESSDGFGKPSLSGQKTEFGTCWVAFEPNQIKAVQNRGTFNPDSNSILESAPIVDDEELVRAMLRELRQGVDDVPTILQWMNDDLEGMGSPWRVFLSDAGEFKARKAVKDAA